MEEEADSPILQKVGMWLSESASLSVLGFQPQHKKKKKRKPTKQNMDS
jgi:hypothetical protein